MRKIKDFLAENWGWSIPIIFVTFVSYTIYNNNRADSIKRLEEENTERIERAEIVADSIYQLEQDSKAKTLLGEIIENEKPFYRENWLEHTSTPSMFIEDSINQCNNKVLISNEYEIYDIYRKNAEIHAVITINYNKSYLDLIINQGFLDKISETKCFILIDVLFIKRLHSIKAETESDEDNDASIVIDDFPNVYFIKGTVLNVWRVNA